MVVVPKRTDVRKDGPSDEENAVVQHQIQRDSVREPEGIPEQLRIQCRWVLAHIPNGVSNKGWEAESLIFPPKR